MSPKYQIFISSTYEDLKAERDQVIKAVLEMGHIPVGMEMFSAADEEQWKIIQRQIDSSDYYVVIVAHRYGSVVPDLGISYTEREYDYAISQGVPALGFVIDGKAEWPHEKYDTETKKKKTLELFKKKVKAKPVNFWKSADDLHAKVAVALMKTFNTQPRPGWIRATEAPSKDVSEEIARISKENFELREIVDNFNKTENSKYSKYYSDPINEFIIEFKERVEPNNHNSQFKTNTIQLKNKEIIKHIYNIFENKSGIFRVKDARYSIIQLIAEKILIDSGFYIIENHSSSLFHDNIELSVEEFKKLIFFSLKEKIIDIDPKFEFDDSELFPTEIGKNTILRIDFAQNFGSD